MTGAPLPLLPLQILFLNMVTDVFPALALGASKGHSDVMAQPPRSKHDAIIGKQAVAHDWFLQPVDHPGGAWLLCAGTAVAGHE